MNRIFSFLLFLVLFLPLTSEAKVDLEFILDLSGSMRKVSAGEAQIDSARNALIQALSKIPNDTHVAVRVYGHRVEQKDKEGSCQDTQLLVPFGANQTSAIKQKIHGLTPKGYTPIASSLEKSKEDFDLTREADKVIILLSDGEETCGGDPVAVLKKLKAEGFSVQVHTVGFNVDHNTRTQLQNISDFSGGQYYNAQGASGLAQALSDATQKALLIDKGMATEKYIEIRGGHSFESAIDLIFKQEYKLDHHQKENEYDYFKFVVEPGEELHIELQTYEKGVVIRENKVEETSRPYAGMILQNKANQKVDSKGIIGTKHKTDQIVFHSGDTANGFGTFYLLIGSGYGSMHKDHVSFKVWVVAKGDVGSNKDAGEDFKTALPIEPQRYPENYLSRVDEKDWFSFKAKKGEEFMVGYFPNGEFPSSVRVKIMDDFKQTLLKQTSKGRDQGLKTDYVLIPQDGTYYLEISRVYSSLGDAQAYGYTFGLMKKEVTE